MGIIMPSRSAIISEIVGPEHLMNAISLNNLGMNVFRILSPALAGFLIDVIDFWAVLCYYDGHDCHVLGLYHVRTSNPR